MKKKTLSIALALTVAMGIALTGCGKDTKTENTTKSEETTVTTTTDEKSSETEQESTEVTDESTETETEEDYTYCNLLSDPYFDMDNAIKDENGTAMVQAALSSAADKEVLYNIIDGDKYVEISGAESYDVNRVFTVSDIIYLYPNLAYYGVNPNPGCSGVPGNKFYCMITSFVDNENTEYIISQNDVTILKAYTIPKEDTGFDTVTGSVTESVTSYGRTDTPALCEVEYNGTHYWTLDISLEQALGELE